MASMKKKLKPFRKNGAVGAKKSAGKSSQDRQIVLLDQGALRRKAASECSQEMARLEKAKAGWKRFEDEDKAGFRRWMAATFGAVLSRLRELESKLGEKEALVREVDEEMFFDGARSHRAAFARVQRRRDQPPVEPDRRAGSPPPEEKHGAKFDEIPEIEIEFLFEDFLRSALGMNPDRMSEAKYEKMFADFKAKIFGQPEPEPERQPQAAPPKPRDNRIKEIYRQLVRRLHPDTRADNDTEVSALWHEVQEAYSAGNLERLETLLALTDIQSNATGEHTSLFQMRAVLKELRRSFNALQRNLSAAKKDPAWNFARLPDHSALQKRVARELESEVSFLERRLGDIEALIASWSGSPKSRKMRTTNSRQADFLF